MAENIHQLNVYQTKKSKCSNGSYSPYLQNFFMVISLT